VEKDNIWHLKSLANREKDWEFIADLTDLIRLDTLALRFEQVSDERVRDPQKHNAYSRIKTMMMSATDFGYGI